MRPLHGNGSQRRTGARRPALLAALLGLLLVLAACTDTTEPTLTLAPANVEVVVGGSVTFTATLQPNNPTASFTWLAPLGSFEGTGAVVEYTAPASPGDYTILVRLAGISGVTATASVSVVAAPPPPILDVTPHELLMVVGDTAEFTAHLAPENPDAEYEWSADGGVITGTGAAVEYTAPETPGDYTLTVSLVGVPDVVASAALTVLAHPPPLQLITTGAEPLLATGTSLELRAEGADAYPGALVWDTTGGQLLPIGSTAVYTAPDEPDEYVVGVQYAGYPETRDELTISVPGGITESFTIVVIPDTQTIVRHSISAYRIVGIVDWILGALSERNIAFVTQVGDVVWDAFNGAQWARAEAGLNKLHGAVPYSISLGDHEYDEEEQKDGDTSEYHKRYGPSRYATFPWYRGSHPDGLSHYQVFEAGGREFLHLSLEWEPIGPKTDASTPLGWAKSVIEANPGIPTLITTHAYLWDEPGEEGHFPNYAREGWRKVGSPDTHFTTSGVGIYEALVEPFPQVFMVFNGHYHKAEDTPERRGEYHQISREGEVYEVYEMLANYQWIGDSSGVGGDDWIRIVTFTPGVGGELDRIEVETFSPERFEDGEEAFKTGQWSRFGFDVDFAARFALP